MKIEAKVVEDSRSLINGDRLTTLQLIYPRYIHAELMTHRVFSRNASSSRAIPVEKLVNKALEDPAFFLHIGKNQGGMQANEQVGPEIRRVFEAEWRELMNIAAGYALRWANDYNIHKQVVNRVMEPWHHICVVVTSSTFTNWDALRRHKDAMPEIHALADAMYMARATSTPRDLDVGEWHLPYISDHERQLYHSPELVKASTARCARTSFMNHDGTTPVLAKDLDLHDKLVIQDPLHASPSEHQATPNGYLRTLFPGWTRSNFSSGWAQYRKFLETGRAVA